MKMIIPGLRPRRARWAFVCLSCLLVVGVDGAFAQTDPPCARPVLTLGEAADLLRVDANELEALALRNGVPGRRIGSAWRFNCATLMGWLNGDRLLTRNELNDITATGSTTGGSQTTARTPSPPADSQQRPIGEAPEERPAEDVLLRGQRVLLGRGEVVIDVGQFYSRSDDHLLAFIDGAVGLTTVEQHAFSTLLVGRVGIFEETELFASTTFLTQRSHQFLGGATLASSRQSDFGDTQIGVRRTLLREGPGRPDIIATLNGQIPTGDRPYAAGAGVVFVKSIDPVVLFASSNYLRAFSRGPSNQARSWPENRVDVSAGYGFALNDTLAISAAVSGLFTGNTSLDNARLRRPGVFVGRFGLTSWLAKDLYIEPSVSFALTGPGEGFAFGVTLPYSF